MKVRAKFRVDGYETTQTRRKIDQTKGWEDSNMETVELRTIKMSPVGSTSPENALFWQYTPSGSIQLGTINPEAWKAFELGKEYYVDFEQA